MRYVMAAPSAMEIEATLLRVGISAETLAAAGTNTTNVLTHPLLLSDLPNTQPTKCSAAR